MESDHNEECIEDTSMEHLLSPDSSDAYNVFGEPELFPRVGDLYQVEIPPLMTELEYCLYMKNPFEVELFPGVPFDFLMGLPIPITWINKEVGYVKHERQELLGASNGTLNKNRLLESDGTKATKISLKVEDSSLKVEPPEIGLENGIGIGDSTNLALDQEMKRKMHKYVGERYCLVPGSFGGPWSDIEEASFLLGLYIFGKNLVQVKRFIDSKKMGDLLSFYYGKFFRSDEYRRWSDCRKMRSRRCAYGQRIFTRSRQQELLSRLSQNVSEECQNNLVEVSKTFGEGKISLEEYVSTLKAIIGINRLVEAVGIGKGKQDLTGVAVETSKFNHIVPMFPEVPPIGKACSSLTPKEIIKFLTGHIRLSKARTSDLFWEAVWPRLLARGWHSEQPRYSLVFLTPGVKKFSRRRLLKGRDYFDSVTDVLSKVASEPGLLELDTETNESNRSKEENGRTSETKLEQNDLSDRKLHCYVQSQTPNHNTDLMKFTVVDTSLEDGKLFRMRELRTLPLEDSTKTTLRSHSEGNDEDSSDVLSEDSDSMDTVLFDLKDKNDSNSKKSASIFQTGSKHRGVPISNSYSGDAYFKNTKDFTKFCDYKKPRESLKCCKRLKEDNLTSLAPVTKRHRRLLSCTRSEVSHDMLGFSASQNFSSSETTDSSENNLHGMKKRVLSTISPKGIFCNTNFGGEASYEKPKQWPLIDLNLPQVPPDFETVETSTIELQQPESSAAPKPSLDVTCTEPNGNSRRQSTRNRPPTARALEALANGFLTTGPSRRNKESSSREASRSRPRRAHGGMVATERFGNGFVSPLTGEVGNGVCDSKSDMYSKFQVLSEGNAVEVPEP
ncbi:uncharacterized protein LOC130756467 isoform X2 [Actinidia eriantha]|uniref:uncharacterized protein LOC130756467 isoform X2 n=1 Tax=Actinidia eriantha TaxID=165200 RepID=UPI00258F8372|nr:uncharacterized protein LOC130756467 isoform X2 [Actinidia eriantha]